jgi:hypothetical protein
MAVDNSGGDFKAQIKSLLTVMDLSMVRTTKENYLKRFVIVWVVSNNPDLTLA